MAKGFTRPISNNPAIVPEELLEAQITLSAKRKLVRILSLKSPTDISVSPGDLVEIYIKQDKQKRGKWLSPRVILDFDPSTSSVTVPGSNGRTIRAAIEDVRHALSDVLFASIVRKANDEIDADIQEIVEQISSSQLNGNVAESSSSLVRPISLPPLFASNEKSVEPNVDDLIEVYWPLEKKIILVK